MATVKRRKKSTAAPDKKKMYEEVKTGLYSCIVLIEDVILLSVCNVCLFS